MSFETLFPRGRKDESPLGHRLSAWALRMHVRRVVAGITRNARIGLKEITGRIWTLISAQSGSELTLLDLRGDGCTRIGAPSDAVYARNHAAGRALARAIHAEHVDIDGLTYVSRLTGEDIYAVFNRGLRKVEATESGMLVDHPQLPEVLARHGIGITI